MTVTTDRNQAGAGLEANRNVQVTRWVAIVAGLIGFVLSVATPLLPVVQTTAMLNWPQNGQLNSVTAPLISLTPVDFTASVPCDVVRGMPPEGGVVQAATHASVSASPVGAALEVAGVALLNVPEYVDHVLVPYGGTRHPVAPPDEDPQRRVLSSRPYEQLMAHYRASYERVAAQAIALADHRPDTLVCNQISPNAVDLIADALAYGPAQVIRTGTQNGHMGPADVLVGLGAVSAYNLDGGSAGIVIAGGRRLNTPRDDEGEEMEASSASVTAIVFER